MVAKLSYASSAWIGFSSANDCQKITAFIRRSKRTGRSGQHDDFSSLCDATDTQLFTEILHNPCHVLQALLTPPADHNYNSRDRPHNRQLPDRMSHLTNCNFIVRMLFCDSCWLYSLFIVLYFIDASVYNCGLTVVLLKRHLIWFDWSLTGRYSPRTWRWVYCRRCVYRRTSAVRRTSTWKMTWAAKKLQQQCRVPLSHKCVLSLSCHNVTSSSLYHRWQSSTQSQVCTVSVLSQCHLVIAVPSLTEFHSVTSLYCHSLVTMSPRHQSSLYHRWQSSTQSQVCTVSVLSQCHLVIAVPFLAVNHYWQWVTTLTSLSDFAFCWDRVGLQSQTVKWFCRDFHWAKSLKF